jgi:hypothetical protein
VRQLRGRAIVAVLEPADVRRHDNPPRRRGPDRTRDRRVLPRARCVLAGLGGRTPDSSSGSGRASERLFVWLAEALSRAVSHADSGVTDGRHGLSNPRTLFNVGGVPERGE